MSLSPLPSVNTPDDLILAYRDLCERHVGLTTSDDIQRRLREWPEIKVMLVKCVDALVAQSETNNAEVWFCLGDALAGGRGVDRNPQLAAQWFRRAAEAGNLRAMVRLGCLLQRDGAKERKQESVQWFQRAAEQEQTSAMSFLGFAYRDGKTVDIDYQKSLAWFKRAFDAGDLHASVLIGRLYARHLNDAGEAVRWLRLAAEMGFEESYVDLAMLHGDRRSTAYDSTESARWYRKVANKAGGSAPRALIALARAARDGQGAEQDRELARSYLEITLQITSEHSEWRREAERLLAEIDGSLL